ncbi:EamA family transporter [Zhihengliuella halotolerans]|uniref:EamA family transporter n=1 Tax=Zhihengliuella halotolerans TaxID=370736 RepID=UPI0021558ABA|nr:EamA family transporter [Zhihengliuella halotolerans]
MKERIAASPLLPILLVLVSILGQQLGASLAGTLFHRVGPQGMVLMRLLFSAVIMIAILRPTLSRLGWTGWRTIIGLGVTMSAMNLMIYEAFDRIPQGVAVTFEALGPLALSVIAGRRWIGLLWAMLAFAGIVLLGRDGFAADGLDPIGVGFALGAAACWAGFILMNREAGRHFPGVAGLALAMCAGTVIAAPFGIATGGTELLDPWVLAIGVGIALLSSAIPYGIETHVLRLLPASTFGMLTCLSPVMAALTAFVVLGQQLGPVDLAAIGCVILACVGAVRTRPAL